MLVRDPVEDRGDGVARATPLGPEVDEDLAVGLRGPRSRRSRWLHSLPSLSSFRSKTYRVQTRRREGLFPARVRSKRMFHAAAGQARSSRARARDPRALGAGGHLRAVAGAQPRRPEVVVHRRPGDGQQVASRVHTAWGRTLKDVFQRYKALRGFDQRYQNGFDCQGLWIEVGVERELGLNSKREIEEYGLEEFARRCREVVVRSSEELTRGCDAPRAVDGLGQRLLHVQRHEHRVHLEVPEDRQRARLALHGPPLDRVVPALRHVALAARADAGRRLPGPRRPVAQRALPAPRPAGPVGRHLDDDALDAAGERRRGRQPGRRVRPARERRVGRGAALPRRHVRRARQGLGARRPALPRAVRRPEAGLGRSSTA